MAANGVLQPSVLNDALSEHWEQLQQQQPPMDPTATTSTDPDDVNDDASSFQWTAVTVIQALVVFVVAGVAEIGGGWLVWKAVRDHRPWWWAVAGSAVLVSYGFIPTLQPTDSFGRVYAVYGGFFIVLSFLAGWWLDADRPDWGDVTGGSIALAGVLVILFWPR
jgi:small multidrug resistance family-3 protein